MYTVYHSHTFALESGDEKKSGNFLSLLSARNAKPMIVGITLTVVLQLTGINTIIYYAPKIFTQVSQ
jgi:hypothetical protein